MAGGESRGGAPAHLSSPNPKEDLSLEASSTPLSSRRRLYDAKCPEIRGPIDFSLMLSNNPSHLIFFTGRGNHGGHITRGRGACGRGARGRGARGRGARGRVIYSPYILLVKFGWSYFFRVSKFKHVLRLQILKNFFLVWCLVALFLVWCMVAPFFGVWLVLALCLLCPPGFPLYCTSTAFYLIFLSLYNSFFAHALSLYNSFIHTLCLTSHACTQPGHTLFLSIG